MIRATLIAACLATPALADLDPTVGTALDICTAPGLSIPTRIEALSSLGWHPPTGAEIDATAAALVLMHFFQSMTLAEGQDAATRAALLAQAQEAMRAFVMAGESSGYFFVNGTGAAVRLASVQPGTAECLVASAASVDDVAGHLGLTPAITVEPLVSAGPLTDAGGTPRALFATLTPGLFGDTVTLPVVLTLPVPLSD